MNKWVNRKLDEKRTTGKGFTLIELIVVVTVLGILAAIVIYAVGNISGSATKAASGTSSSEVTAAEQSYCQANGTYGDLNQLVAAGYLTNPNPNLTIYTYTVPANAQLFNGCGTSVYDAFPQTINQPDGTPAVLAAPPTRIITVDGVGYAAEQLAVLGLSSYGGNYSNNTGTSAQINGPLGITPLMNTTNFAPMFQSVGSPNYQAIAAARPQLILGVYGEILPATVTGYEAIAPLLSINTANSYYYPSNPQSGDLSLLYWLPQLVQLASVTNTQVQAAAFITAFQNAAAAVGPQLAGKTVSIMVPTGSPVSGFQFQGISGPTELNGELLEYLGMNVICPNCEPVENLQTYNMTLSEVSSSTVTAQYLEISFNSDTADCTSLIGTPTSPGSLGSVLPQIAAGGVSCSSFYGATTPATTGTGFPGPTTVNLPSPLTSYCSIQGVAYTLPVANAPTTVNGSLQNPPQYCPAPATSPYTASSPQYTAVTLPYGVGTSGPLTALAAIPFIPLAFPTGA